MRIKICGITNIKDALFCTALGADAIGFVFYRKSKRYVEIEKAAEISAALPPFINKVGVFVDEKPAVINDISCRVGLTNIQLSGNEIVKKKIYDLPVIQTFRVNANFDFNKIYCLQNGFQILPRSPLFLREDLGELILKTKSENHFRKCTYNSQTDDVLLDVFDKIEYGGTGKSFNWEIIPNDLRKQIILAGGISIENIEKIFCEIRPAAVDLSSSLEEYPGKKDHNKVKHFFEKINKLRGSKC